MLVVAQRKRFTYDEKEITRARNRIHQALDRLAAELQAMDSKVLHHVKSVVEHTAVEVGDTKAGVERTEKGVERAEKGIERTEVVVGDTKAGVERAEKGIELTKAGVDKLHDQENVDRQTRERQKVMRWICPSEIDYITQQNALTSRRQQGIGEWFVEAQEFKDWLQKDRATLLCSGKPGAGKTMTTSFVVNNVLERYGNDKQIAVAYIYCQYPLHKEQTPEYLMTSVLRQLLGQRDTLSDQVRASYKSKNEGERKLNPNETFDLLNIVLRLFKKTFIIIDALDELPSAACIEVMSRVFDLQGVQHQRVCHVEVH